MKTRIIIQSEEVNVQITEDFLRENHKRMNEKVKYNAEDKAFFSKMADAIVGVINEPAFESLPTEEQVVKLQKKVKGLESIISDQSKEIEELNRKIRNLDPDDNSWDTWIGGFSSW